MKYNYIDFSNNNFTFVSYFVNDKYVKHKKGGWERKTNEEEMKELNKKVVLYRLIPFVVFPILSLSSFITNISFNKDFKINIFVLLLIASILILPTINLCKMHKFKTINFDLYNHLCDFAYTNVLCKYCDIETSAYFVKDVFNNEWIYKTVHKISNYKKYELTDGLKDKYLKLINSLVPNSIFSSVFELLISIFGSVFTLINLASMSQNGLIRTILLMILYVIGIIVVTVLIFSCFYENKLKKLEMIYHVFSYASLEMPYKLTDEEVISNTIVLDINLMEFCVLHYQIKIFNLLKKYFPEIEITIRDIYIHKKIIIFIKDKWKIENTEKFKLFAKIATKDELDSYTN